MFAASSALKSSSSIQMVRSASGSAVRSRTSLLPHGPTSLSRSSSRMSNQGSTTPTMLNMFANLTFESQRSAVPPTLRTVTQRRGLTSMAHVQTPETIAAVPETTFAQAAAHNANQQAKDFTLAAPRRPSLTQTIKSSAQIIVSTATNATNRIKFRQTARKVVTLVRFSEFPKREFKMIETTEVETVTLPATPRGPLRSCRDRPPTPYPDHSLEYFAPA